MSAPTKILVSSIVADDANQPRTDDLDVAYVEQLMEVPDLWPPVTVVEMGAGRYSLVDGFHRYEAALRLNRDEIFASILACPADGDLVSLAFGLNAQHGRALSRADRRRHAEHQLKLDHRQSDRNIAQKCGVSPATVGDVRSRLEHGAVIEQSTQRVGADGRTYSAPERKPGELPDKPLHQLVGDGVQGLFDSRERRQMRETARYLQRLLVALADAQNLPGWESPAGASRACVETLGAEKARRLADEVAPLLTDILEVVETIASTSPP